MQTAKRGRPRSPTVKRNILKAALKLLEQRDLQKVSVESIARKAKVGKGTIYRWWPNKSAVIMEAFLETVAPGIKYDETDSPLDDVVAQMKRLFKTYSQPPGKTFLHLIAQAQFDDELAAELRNYVIERRVAAKTALQRAVDNRLIKGNTDLDVALDQLYAPIFYRLLAGYGEITEEFIEAVFAQVMSGIGAPR